VYSLASLSLILHRGYVIVLHKCVQSGELYPGAHAIPTRRLFFLGVLNLKYVNKLLAPFTPRRCAFLAEMVPISISACIDLHHHILPTSSSATFDGRDASRSDVTALAISRSSTSTLGVSVEDVSTSAHRRRYSPHVSPSRLASFASCHASAGTRIVLYSVNSLTESVGRSLAVGDGHGLNLNVNAAGRVFRRVNLHATEYLATAHFVVDSVLSRPHRVTHHYILL